MSQVSAFLRKSSSGYSHWCPGCKHAHHIWTEVGSAHIWQFDGNVDVPTFSPSVRIFWPAVEAEGEYPAEPEQTLCHYFITAGELRFCGDCAHALSGKTVPLPPLSDAGDYAWSDK